MDGSFLPSVDNYYNREYGLGEGVAVANVMIVMATCLVTFYTSAIVGYINLPSSLINRRAN